MMRLGQTFRSWLLGTTFYTPPALLMSMSFSKEYLKKVDKENARARSLR